MTKYYCKLCSNNKNRLVQHSKGVLFEKHKEYSFIPTKSEIWIDSFRKSWNKYSIDSHKKTTGSKKQIQQSNFSKMCNN